MGQRLFWSTHSRGHGIYLVFTGLFHCGKTELWIISDMGQNVLFEWRFQRGPTQDSTHLVNWLSNKVVHKTKRLKNNTHARRGGGLPKCLSKILLRVRKSFRTKYVVDSGLQHGGIFSIVQPSVSIK